MNEPLRLFFTRGVQHQSRKLDSALPDPLRRSLSLPAYELKILDEVEVATLILPAVCPGDGCETMRTICHDSLDSRHFLARERSLKGRAPVGFTLVTEKKNQPSESCPMSPHCPQENHVADKTFPSEREPDTVNDEKERPMFGGEGRCRWMRALPGNETAMETSREQIFALRNIICQAS